MPRREGIWLDPGRARVSEKKGCEGALAAGVREKRLEDMAAPSEALPVVAGMACWIKEFNGRARPRIPSKLYDNGSLLTVVAAAA